MNQTREHPETFEGHHIGKFGEVEIRSFSEYSFHRRSHPVFESLSLVSSKGVPQALHFYRRNAARRGIRIRKLPVAVKSVPPPGTGESK